MSGTGRAIALLEAGVPSGLVPNLVGASSFSEEFSVVWNFALRVGAPVKEALRELGALEDGARAASFELQQSLALPRATKNLMVWLPVFGLFLSQAFGLQPFSAFTNPLGIASFGLAILLLFIGDRIAEKMIRSLAAHNPDTDLNLLLLAIALRSGISLKEAQLHIFKKPIDQSFALNEILKLTFETGAPISQLLISTARENREAKTSFAISQAKALSVKLLAPLGLTVLPAFLLLTVVPVLISQLMR